jgi:hypothetical protein
MRWEGYVACMETEQYARSFGRKVETKGPLGITGCGWNQDTKTNVNKQIGRTRI